MFCMSLHTLPRLKREFGDHYSSRTCKLNGKKLVFNNGSKNSARFLFCFTFLWSEHCFGCLFWVFYVHYLYFDFLCYFGFFSLVENNFLAGNFKTKTKMSYALHICCILSTVVDSQQTWNKCCKLAICENRLEKWKKNHPKFWKSTYSIWKGNLIC